MIKPRMTACLKQLHLPAFVEHYAPQAALAGNEGWPYDRYLLGLCELEVTEREQWRIQRLLTDSKLPREKTLAAFDRNRIKKTVDRQFAVLMEGDFLNRRENVLVFGNPGSGKSHLLSAVAQELIVGRERKMHFTKCSLLIQDLLAAKRDLRLSKEIKRLNRYEGLIIDDLGYLQQSREDMDVVFTLLAERYERGSVLMTSNLAFSKWEGIFKDAMMTAAAIDRLVHHCVIIELNIPSYRAEEAKKKQQAENE